MPPNHFVELDRSTWRDRLEAAIEDRQTILVCGLSSWEREDAVNMLISLIPRDKRVLVAVDKNENAGHIQEESLPKNSVVMTYNLPEASFSDIIRASSKMAGNYLVISGLAYKDLEVFETYTVPAFEGLIAALNVPLYDPILKRMSGLVIEIVSRTKAKDGINAIYSLEK